MPPDSNNSQDNTAPVSTPPITPPQPATETLAPPIQTPSNQPTVPQTNEPEIIHPQEPQAQTGATNTPPPSPNLKPSHTIRNIFLFLIIFSFASFGSGIVLAYNNYPLIKPPIPIQNALDAVISLAPVPKPTRIILESTIAKAAKLKSADQKTEFSLSTNSQSAPISAFKLTVAGPIEFGGQEKQMAEADLGLEVKFEGAAFTGSASVKQIDKTIYFKVNEVPFGQFYQQLLDYKGKWYYYNIPPDYLPKEEDKQSNAKFTKVISDFIAQSHQWTKVTTQDGDAYTMDITPPKNELDKLIFDIIDAYEPKDQDKVVTDLDREELSKATDKIKNLKITTKVGKKDYFLRRVEVSFDVTVDNFSLPIGRDSLMPNNQVTFNINLTTELTNHNKKVVIIPPTDAQNIEDIAKEIQKKYENQIPTQELLPNNTQTQPPAEKNQEAFPEQNELDDPSLKSLLSPDEIVLGQKTNWEQTTLKLFSLLLN
ncbi:MAG: hypothetical protein AAB512_05095 [Patescibacteria group bacterium]